MNTAKRNRSGSILLSLLILSTMSLQAQGQRFLTEPSEGEPVQIALQFLDTSKDDLELSASDLADLVVKDKYVSQHSGVTHIYFQQRLGGVEVVNGILNINVMPDGRIVNLGNRFISDLARGANTTSPSLQAPMALRRAAEDMGIAPTRPIDVLDFTGGPAMEARLSDAGISRDPVPARLMYLPVSDEEVRLVWSLVIRQVDSSNWWNLFVDTRSGETLEKFNWTVNEGESFGAASRLEAASGSVQLAEDSCLGPECYQVFALPKESPDDGPRTYEESPGDAFASPWGWHDTDGAPGAEFTDTRGNNVEAQTDLDADDSFTPGTDIRSEGGPSRIFEPVLDLATQQPEEYQEAAVVNLFYWNNVMHDLSYRYGFDEPAGNFQQNNYGNGGAQGDPVQADAQDGEDILNANFSTPPDGTDPRMQMFVWPKIENARLTVNSPGGIAGDYAANRGAWGGLLTPPTTADLEIVDDGSGNPSHGCGALVDFTTGNIALIDRGTCNFSNKALNAQNAGAVGAVIVNNQQLPNGLVFMGPGNFGDLVTIPAVMVGSADGQIIKTQLQSSSVNSTIQEPVGGVPLHRDSDLDNGVIAHEYGHGISNRLVGGPANVGCLFNGEQMGEGWSDWWMLALTPDPADTGETPRAFEAYVLFQPPTGPGRRNFPYSTDMAVNPLTYGDVATATTVWDRGEIWAATLWEMYWNLVDRDGFDPDLYSGTGGNNLAIQLVVDGMKMTPCSPTFVDARDAILAADETNNAGANLCTLWEAFAKRGLGANASGGSPNAGDEVEDFDLPDGSNPGQPNCLSSFSDGFESGDTSAWSVSVP